MVINFSKMHGLGNDFVVIDAVSNKISLQPEQIRFLADRHFGVGCDQVLLVEPAQDSAADFRFRIYNSDGNEVEQCGNGARCFARFVRDHGLSDKDEIVVETAGGLIRPKIVSGGCITVDMGVPVITPDQIPFDAEDEQISYDLVVNGQQYDVGVVSMGNPHAVLQTDDVYTAPVGELGPLIESHERFPKHVNVGFMEVLDRAHIRLRVFERGVGETLACGSGACAAVVVGHRKGILDDRVSVELPGGTLVVEWSGDDQPVSMTGSATNVFEGKIEL